MRELRANTDLDSTFPAGAGVGKDWFAVSVKHQHEATVHSALAAKQLHCYAPSYGAIRRWSDRVKRVERPLFPGYVFCEFAFENRKQVLTTPGVSSIVSFGAEAIAVPAEEIVRIKRMLAAPYMLEPWPFLQAGQQVRITAGPLSGLTGVFQRRGEGGRLIVSIEILRRSVAVHFEAGDLMPVDDRPFFIEQ
jgi:transcription antitermination factor NusG